MLNEMHMPEKENIRVFTNAVRLLDLAVKRAKAGAGAACIITELREIAQNAGFHSSTTNPANCSDAAIQHPARANENDRRDEIDGLGDANALATCQDNKRSLDWNLQRCVHPLFISGAIKFTTKIAL
jgi:hypothetical protein